MPRGGGRNRHPKHERRYDEGVGTEKGSVALGAVGEIIDAQGRNESPSPRAEGKSFTPWMDLGRLSPRQEGGYRRYGGGS